MTEIDWDAFPKPLQMARGSHKEGTGFGCAMNVISYITGDVHISDYPRCSHPMLSEVVQWTNDQLALRRGKPIDVPGQEKKVIVLAQDDVLTMLRLGTKTIGTNGKVTLAQLKDLILAVHVKWVELMEGHVPSVDEVIRLSNRSMDSWGSPFQLLHHRVLRDLGPDAMVELTEDILDGWRSLAGLDKPVEVPESVVAAH